MAPGGPASSLAPEPENFALLREAGERKLSDEVPADNRLEKLPAVSEKKEYRAAEPAPLQERAEAPHRSHLQAKGGGGGRGNEGKGGGEERRGKGRGGVDARQKGEGGEGKEGKEVMM